MAGFFDRFRGQSSGPDPEAEPVGAQDLERIDRANREARAPWDQLPGESDADFRLFSAYLAERSDNVSAFARQVHDRSESTIQGIAQRKRWRDRKAALRVRLDQERIEAATGAARDLGAAWGHILAEATDWVLQSILTHKAEGRPLTPSEARAMIKPLHDIKQLLDDKPTEIRETRLTGKSAEYLNELETLLDKYESETRTEH